MTELSPTARLESGEFHVCQDERDANGNAPASAALPPPSAFCAPLRFSSPHTVLPSARQVSSRLRCQQLQALFSALLPPPLLPCTLLSSLHRLLRRPSFANLTHRPLNMAGVSIGQRKDQQH